MLNALRKQAGSWVVKALLMLLVVSFAIWGIGDVFFGGSQNPAVAKVGESEISANELAEAFNQSLRNLQQSVGTQINREQAIQLGLMQQALQDLIARRLVDLRASDMGLTVTDATLRQMITSNPVFQTGGQFGDQIGGGVLDGAPTVRPQHGLVVSVGVRGGLVRGGGRRHGRTPSDERLLCCCELTVRRVFVSRDPILMMWTVGPNGWPAEVSWEP